MSLVVEADLPLISPMWRISARPSPTPSLEEGTPVFDRNGKKIGVVEQVLADMQLDIFEGVIIDPRPLPGKNLYADVDQIADLRERGVVLAVTRDELRDPPDEQNRRKRAEGADTPETPLAGLRRAWDRLTRRRAG